MDNLFSRSVTLLMHPGAILMRQRHLRSKLLCVFAPLLLQIIALAFYRLSQPQILALLLCSLLLTAYLAFGFYQGLMAALQQVSHSAQAVAAGDLTNKIVTVGNDELAQSGATFEQMNLNLSALVANVRTNASVVTQLGQQLAVGISDLSARTEQQAANLEETSSNVENLVDAVKKNAQSAHAVDTLASNLSLIAQSSGASMRAAVGTMQQIQSSARQVQEIVSIIDGIAFQTNILALNAAVEAARAGEQGRGFAVVASEVRHLAQRSAESARQIKHLIDESVTRVNAGVAQIGEVNDTLTDIVSGIGELATNVNAISTASTTQSTGLADISVAIHDLDHITQSNGQMADEANELATTLVQRAQRLSGAVASFKLRQGTADEAYALVKKATALYKASKSTALKIITADKGKLYSDRDMYVFAFDRRGQYIAFAGNPAKLAVNLLEVKGLNGRKLIDDAFAVPDGGGWVDYSIPNPVSKKIESKSSYIERVADNLVIGCGVYKVT